MFVFAKIKDVDVQFFGPKIYPWITSKNTTPAVAQQKKAETENTILKLTADMTTAKWEFFTSV